jgi:hypothetical protein
MTMFNDLFQLLADVPLMLVAAWAVWFGAGALLLMWFRRVEYDVEMPAPRPVAKPKPVSRPSSSPDLQVAETPAPFASERPKSPLVVGDPYGDLATLLDQPAASVAAEPAPAATRAPAESPILSSSGSPIRRANNTGSDYSG